MSQWYPFVGFITAYMPFALLATFIYSLRTHKYQYMEWCLVMVTIGAIVGIVVAVKLGG